MDGARSTTRLFLATALCGALLAASSGVRRAAARPAAAITGGTITIVAADHFGQTGSDTRTIDASCRATIHVTSASTASADITYTYQLTEVQQLSPGVTHSHTATGSGTEHLDALPRMPEIRLNGDGTYTLSIPSPEVQVTYTETDQTTGRVSPSPSTYSNHATCPDRVSTPSGTTEQPTGNLTGSATISGSGPIAYDWASIRGNGSGQISWTLTDPTLGTATAQPTARKPIELPNAKIHVTNKGIEASLDYKGLEISYAKDWKADQKAPGTAPTITSPDRQVQITLQESNAGTPAGTAAHAAVAADTQGVANPRVVYTPFAAGGLHGLMATITLPNGTTLIIVALGDGRHLVLAEIDARPHTPLQDLIQAGAALGSITVSG